MLLLQKLIFISVTLSPFIMFGILVLFDSNEGPYSKFSMKVLKGWVAYCLCGGIIYFLL